MRNGEYFYVLEGLRMLAVHSDPAISHAALTSLDAHDRHGNTMMFRLLHMHAEDFNPYKRKDGKHRQKCLDTADGKMRHSHRCAVAQLFYELSEGLYRQTTYMRRVLSAKYPIDLTQQAA